MNQLFLIFSLFPFFVTPPSLHAALTCGWGVSNDQTTGNVWVTHEEMESLAATPPTVSLP